MTALSVSESEDSTAAILTLLGMGIKTVPHEVLRLKFSEASKTFLDILMKYSELENPAILRAVSDNNNIDFSYKKFPLSLTLLKNIFSF